MNGRRSEMKEREEREGEGGGEIDKYNRLGPTSWIFPLRFTANGVEKVASGGMGGREVRNGRGLDEGRRRREGMRKGERGRGGGTFGDRMVCFSSLTVYSVVLSWLEWKLRDI